MKIKRSLSSVNVEYIKRENREVSRRVRAMTAKKCTKKRDDQMYVQSCCFVNLSRLLFFAFSLPSPSTFFKLPNIHCLRGKAELLSMFFKADRLLKNSFI